jgi:tRNA (guanine37-N1)-methyltransferase
MTGMMVPMKIDPMKIDPIKIDIVSIFVEYFEPLHLSLVGKAIENGIVDLQVHNLRDWTSDRHRNVDDTPYGGGAGMVMRPEPWGLALDNIDGRARRSRLLVLSHLEGRSDQTLPRSWRRSST